MTPEDVAEHLKKMVKNKKYRDRYEDIIWPMVDDFEGG